MDWIFDNINVFFALFYKERKTAFDGWARRILICF